MARIQTMCKTKGRQRLLVLWDAWASKMENQYGKEYFKSVLDSPEKALKAFSQYLVSKETQNGSQN